MPDDEEIMAARYLRAALELLAAAVTDNRTAGLTDERGEPLPRVLSDEKILEVGRELPEGSGHGVAINLINLVQSARTLGADRALRHAGLTAARILAGLDNPPRPPA